MDSTPIKRMSEHSKARGPCVRVFVCACVLLYADAASCDAVVQLAPGLKKKNSYKLTLTPRKWGVTDKYCS